MKTSILPALRPPSFARFALFAGSVLFPVFLFAAAPADCAFTRPILGADLAAPRLVEVRLDAPVFAATQSGYADLRLFNAAGQELPRLVEPLFTLQERIARHPVASHPTTLRELPDNRIEARFELEKDALPPVGIAIRTPLRDFIRTVHIYGSEDGQTWEPLVADAEIFDYSRYMDIRRTEIPLPPNPYRHYSVEISNAAEERAQPLIRLVQANGQDQSRAIDLLQTPFRIDGVSFWREAPAIDRDQPVLQEWPPSGMAVAQDLKAKTTAITLQTGGAPLTRVELDTPARNFQRAAAIQIPALANGQKTWRTVGTGKFTRVDVSGLATNLLTIDFPEQRAAELRVVLQNNDNPPLDVTALRAQGPTYRLLWLADPAVACRLAYGNDSLPAPAYDLFAIRAALASGIVPDLWSLGAPVATPRHHPFALGEFLSRPAVFGTALVLAALALLGLLAKALKKAA